MVLKNVRKFSPLLELLKHDIRDRVAYRVPAIIGTRITTPIGLDIGSETPAEIAVSIAAQLIEVRAQR